MKKTLAIILAILMIATTIPMAFAADVVKSGTFNKTSVNWALDSDNVLTISGEGTMGTYAGYAFNSSFQSSVKKVIIEEGVTDIYNGLFRNWSSLTSVYIADSVETIKDDAFRYCDKLTTICIGSGVKEIGYGVFMTNDMSLRKVIHYNGTEDMWRNIYKDQYYNQSPDIHYLEKISKPATCTEDGQEALVCTKCDETFRSKVIPASHTIETVDAKTPTCTEIGWDAYEYCTACTYTTYVEKGTLDHSLVLIKTTPAECGVPMVDFYNCEFCCNFEVAKPKFGTELFHSFTKYEITEAPTCNKAGEKAAPCDNGCGEIDVQTVPALDDHVDADGDYKCDFGCGYEFEKPAEPEAPADDICPDCGRPAHEDNFAQKIVCFVLMLINIIKGFF